MDILSRLKAKATPVTVNLPADLLEGVDSLVKASGASRQAVVLELVREALQAQGTQPRPAQAPKTGTKPRGRVLSAADKAALSRKLKAYWAAKKKGEGKKKG